MRSVVTAVLCVSVGGSILSLVAAQERKDPRVGLKAGLHDAGEAAWNMERIAGLSKPEGFLIDEPYESLGKSFQVPPVFADRKEQIIEFLTGEPLVY